MYLSLMQSVINASFTKDESISSNIKNFTFDFVVDDVSNYAHNVASLVLQSASDETITTSNEDCNAIDNAYCASLFTLSTTESIVKL